MRRRCGPAPGADLIGREFGIQYHAGHVWKLLRQLGWSPQRPAGRALERNEEAIGEWKRRTWPAIRGCKPECVNGFFRQNEEKVERNRWPSRKTWLTSFWRTTRGRKISLAKTGC